MPHEWIQKYVDVEELTQTIVNEYIKKIVVYAPDKSSGKRKQKVKIFFNFVDDVDILVISEPIVTQTTYERRKTAWPSGHTVLCDKIVTCHY